MYHVVTTLSGTQCLFILCVFLKPNLITFTKEELLHLFEFLELQERTCCSLLSAAVC